ncbi:hypothetical protein IAU60_006353 [Kwoniella sp. DSM 27419]
MQRHPAYPPSQDPDSPEHVDDDTPRRKLGKVDRGREACNECRRHKIRCHPHPDDPQHLFPCSRCERMNITCEFAKHNRGRKRKRPVGLDLGGPSSGTRVDPSRPPLDVDHASHPHSLGDPRFPFISNDPDAVVRRRTSTSPQAAKRERGLDEEYRHAHPQMSLRHMLGEDTRGDGSTSDDSEDVQEEPTPDLDLRKRRPGRGPELVDDPIRAGYVDETEARALFHLKESSFLYTAICECARWPAPLTPVSVTSRYLSSLSATSQSVQPESAQSVHQQILVLARDHMTWAFAEAIATIDVVRAMVILAMNKEPDDDKAWYHISRVGLVALPPLTTATGRAPGQRAQPGAGAPSGRGGKVQRGRAASVEVPTAGLAMPVLCQLDLQHAVQAAHADPPVGPARGHGRSRSDSLLRDTQLVCSVELRRKYLHYRDLLVGSGADEPAYRSALSLSMLTRTMNQDWDVNKPRIWTSSLRLNLNLLIVNQTLSLPADEQIHFGSPDSIPAFHHCLNAATTVLLRMEGLDRTQLTFASDTFLHFALYAATLLSTTADALDAASAYPSDSPTLHAYYLRRLAQMLPQLDPSALTTASIPTAMRPSSASSTLTQNMTHSATTLDPTLQGVTTNMPVDPALTSVMGTELDFFLGDFPWVGLDTTPAGASDQALGGILGTSPWDLGSNAQPFSVQNADLGTGTSTNESYARGLPALDMGYGTPSLTSGMTMDGLDGFGFGHEHGDRRREGQK